MARGEAIVQHIDHVIGMSDALPDHLALEFAVAFYDALGAGENVEFAFKLACGALRLAGCQGEQIPVLKSHLHPRHAPPESSRKPTKPTQSDGGFHFGNVAGNVTIPISEAEDEKPGSGLFFSAEDLAALEAELLALQQAQAQAHENSEVRGKKLRELQADIYQRCNELKIYTFSDYQGLTEQARNGLKQEILAKMAGLEQRPENLLDPGHVNTCFPEALLRSEKISWDMLHRKTAIYSDLALIGIDALTIHARGEYASHGYLPDQAMLDDQTIHLLLLHRPLIEQGKMSVVPEVLKRMEANGRETTLFNIDDLGAVDVNLKDKEIQAAFFEQGKLFQPAGNLVFRSPHGMGLNLEQILEIIQDKYPTEYKFFQTSLRNTMLSINPEDDTQALRRAIRAVDEGIAELEVKYETAKRQFNQPAPGGLALVLYAPDGEDSARFVKAAFQDPKLSELVSFAPSAEAIPPEIRHSPFFIPWLIRHQGEMPQDLPGF